MKPKDTYYRGNYFRSRLEASWAVCFDVLGVAYQYEPTKFQLSNGSVYMPDFYFPKYDFYAEVKPFPVVDERWSQFEAPLVLMFSKPHFTAMPMLEQGKEPVFVIPFADLLDPPQGSLKVCEPGTDGELGSLLFRTAVYKANTYRFEEHYYK